MHERHEYMTKGVILVVDDEKDLIDLVRYNLEKEGYQIISAGDGESGIALAIRQKPDLIIADLMLPGMDGLEACRQLREKDATTRIPIIILTAKTSESDRVVGLEIGADDYITKPFSPRELVARVRALLRRSSGFKSQATIVRRGDLVVDSAGYSVSCGNRKVDLTATEFRLLQFLISNPGFVYSRSALIDGALGRDITVLDRTIDVHVMSLRKKLGKCGLWVETVRGFGYKFREEDSGDTP
jgi:two-component system, OmpR family, alkaline phosphatase synthesis response regulator PhoP